MSDGFSFAYWTIRVNDTRDAITINSLFVPIDHVASTDYVDTPDKAIAITSAGITVNQVTAPIDRLSLITAARSNSKQVTASKARPTNITDPVV